MTKPKTATFIAPDGTVRVSVDTPENVAKYEALGMKKETAAAARKRATVTEAADPDDDEAKETSSDDE